MAVLEKDPVPVGPGLPVPVGTGGGVGASVGSSGCSVGSSGCSVGSSGCSVGSAVGSSVGSAVGSSVAVGSPVSTGGRSMGAPALEHCSSTASETAITGKMLDVGSS